jgi:hypothetical protein
MSESVYVSPLPIMDGAFRIASTPSRSCAPCASTTNGHRPSMEGYA